MFSIIRCNDVTEILLKIRSSPMQCPATPRLSLASSKVHALRSPSHLFSLSHSQLHAANVGDTSPNTLGAFCESPGEPWDGQPCEFEHSTCGNTTEDCHGRGPGFTISDFASNEIIGGLQMQGAQTVMNANNRTAVSGSVRSVHVYLNMCV